MTMRPARLLCMLALVAGLAVGAGCGSDSGTIDPTAAQGLKDGLEDVRAAVADGDCPRVRSSVESVRSKVTNLDAPARLKSNLREGLGNLSSAAGNECEDAAQQQETTTVETTTVTVPTETTETTTTPTETIPTQTTPTVPTTPTDTTTTEPPTGGVTPDDGTAGDAGDAG